MLTAREIYERLLAAYGQPGWWSDDPYRVMVQSVLVQNTAWPSVLRVTQAAEASLAPERILAMTPEALKELIRPCGFCTRKAETIRRLTQWYAGYGFDVKRTQACGQAQLRRELLAVKGVGAETADVILVYALHKPSFVVDAYTRRLLRRLGFAPDDDDDVRSFFEAELAPDARLYGWYHWLILTHSIERCRKTPVCGACPFYDVCQRNR